MGFACACLAISEQCAVVALQKGVQKFSPDLVECFLLPNFGSENLFRIRELLVSAQIFEFEGVVVPTCQLLVCCLILVDSVGARCAVGSNTAVNFGTALLRERLFCLFFTLDHNFLL